MKECAQLHNTPPIFQDFTYANMCAQSHARANTHTHTHKKCNHVVMKLVAYKDLKVTKTTGHSLNKIVLYSKKVHYTRGLTKTKHKT